LQEQLFIIARPIEQRKEKETGKGTDGKEMAKNWDGND
jgi:hypothetical protein